MFEFTDAYLTPFNWAKNAYQYMLNQVPNNSLQITKSSLTSIGVESELGIVNQEFTESYWNSTSLNFVSTVGALYQTIDQSEAYFNSMYSLISSRLTESEKRVQEQESNLKILLNGSKNIASTAVHIKGGDSSYIEQDEKYYRNYGLLEFVPNEGVFRLKDTGFFSSIRSLGGFAGSVAVDFTLGEYSSNGDIRSIADGVRNTFWATTFYAPAPVRADQSDVAWLPNEYKHGFSMMLTYYMDRPTLATEVYVDPITTEPMDLVSVSWTPMTISTAIQNGSFTTSGNWTYVGGASFLASSLGLGIASGSCVSTSTSGWVSQTFGVSGNYLASGSVDLVTTGRRCQVHYNMKGLGDLVAGVRLSWLNSSGKVVQYKLKEDFPTAFFSSYRLVDYAPTDAVSGRIEFGIFTPTTSASAYFDEVEVLMGERNFSCEEVIDRPKTISLPEIARSGRFSFTFAQRNPRREILAKESVGLELPNISGNLDLDSSLQQATVNLGKKLLYPGPGTSIFSYRLGLKELDLRYREHTPRGSLVSLPLDSRKEIRNIWVTAEVGQSFNDNTKFCIYPFSDNSEYKLYISPFLIGEVDSATTNFFNEGNILKVYTPEEETAGWINYNDTYFVTAPRFVTESFDGTTRESKIKLMHAPHFRRVLFKNVKEWLTKYSIWTNLFDPNLGVIYGLPENMLETKTAIRNNTASGFQLDDLISREGYIPLKVTVSTDKWTAVPDQYGRPDVSKVRTAIAEQLTETTVVETTVEVQEDYLSLDAWLASTLVSTFIRMVRSGFNPINASFSTIERQFSSLSPSLQQTITLKEMTENLKNTNIFQEVIALNYLRSSYDGFKAQGKIPKNTQKTRTTTAAVEINDVFKTRFSPIITGQNGTFLQLYWFDPTNIKYSPMSRSAFELVNPEIGLVKVLQAAPASSFTSILADYKYISNTEVEDHYGSVIDFSVAASSISGLTSNIIGLRSKPFPVTRNMTDYENGKIPTLKYPDFDRLSKTYYPVIEYYINSDGELIFARDFFKFGDIPAKVSIEYETLAIQPRLGVEVTRAGSPASTPTIQNLSLRVRESSPLPVREVM